MYDYSNGAQDYNKVKFFSHSYAVIYWDNTQEELCSV
jgi:hypothetical protein